MGKFPVFKNPDMKTRGEISLSANSGLYDSADNFLLFT